MKTTPFLPLILLAFTLSACASAGAPAEPGLTRDRWTARVDGQVLAVERVVTISEPAAGLLRGSPALAAAALEADLLAGGAGEAACTSSAFAGQVTLRCRSTHTLPPAAGDVPVAVPLPAPGPLAALFELPVSAAADVTVQAAGTLEVPGVIAALPELQRWSAGDGSHGRALAGLRSLSRMFYTAEYRLAPGSALAPSAPPEARFQPRYIPALAAWLGWGTALVFSLAALAWVIPLRRSAYMERPQEPRPPKLDHLPRLLRWLARLIMRIVYWLRIHWPHIFNTLLAVWLLVTGAQMVMAAFPLARGYEDAAWKETAFDLMTRFPPATLLAFLLEDAWVLFTAAAGALMVLLGIGLLARKNGARVALFAIGLTLFAALLAGWPVTLLSPEFVPAQVELALAAGGLSLAGLTLALYTLRHPSYRLLFLEDR